MYLPLELLTNSFYISLSLDDDRKAPEISSFQTSINILGKIPQE